MQITDIKIRKFFEEGPMKAVVSVTFDDCLAVHDIKVIEGQDVYVKADVDAQIAAAETNANTYTDQLKNSIQFASNADIDDLFV